MTEYPPPNPDQNPAVPEQRDQSNTPSDQTWYSSAEPPTTIAPVPAAPAPEAYPASPAAYPASPAYPTAYPTDPYQAPADPYQAPADPYQTTPYSAVPYPPAPAPAGYPYGQPSAPPYGQPAVALFVAPPSSGAATASLVLGIIGIVLGWCVCGIPSLLAIIFGHVGLRQTRNNAMSGHGMAVAGLVMGYVLIVPTIIVTVLFLGWLGVFGAAAANSTAGY